MSVTVGKPCEMDFVIHLCELSISKFFWDELIALKMAALAQLYVKIVKKHCGENVCHRVIFAKQWCALF